MVLQIFKYLCLLLAFVSGAPISLQLNPFSTIREDIQSITHFPEQRKVVIVLNSHRRCNNPTFIVRLSGVSMYLLDLVQHDHTEPIMDFDFVKNFFRGRESTYHFNYPELLDEGSYYIEALVLVCTYVDINNFKDVCVEDVQQGRNILNLPYSFTVDKLSDTLAHRRPRWVLNSTAQSILLPTRYQKNNCDSPETGGICTTKESELHQHNLYVWTDKPDYKDALKQVLKLTNSSIGAKVNISGELMGHQYGTPITVCLIGASHSNRMADFGNSARPNHLHKHFLFIPIYVTHPDGIDVSRLEAEKCNYAVVGLGQWPLSFLQQPAPFTIDRLEASMRAVVKKLSAPSYQGDIQVFLRSMNYNALGSIYTSCPPYDHRLPHVIDAYNAVQKKLCAELGVGFIDLHSVIGPLWDGASDWNHALVSVFIAEAEFVLHSVLMHSLKHKITPTPRREIVFPPEETLIRFANAPSVYLYKHGTLHEFPSAAVFVALGYDFDDVQVLAAEKKTYFVFTHSVGKWW